MLPRLEPHLAFLRLYTGASLLALKDNPAWSEPAA
jgi:hypothetical protein